MAIAGWPDNHRLDPAALEREVPLLHPVAAPRGGLMARAAPREHARERKHERQRPGAPIFQARRISRSPAH